MIVLSTVSDMRYWLHSQATESVDTGFVPTMGYLHDGHMSLVNRAKAENALVIASIFVNPTQFGPNEDLTRYPADFDGDFRKLESAGVDALFHPEHSELYQEGFQTFVEVMNLSVPLCGEFRPGHFRGVATVVLKLFNIIRPTRAYFGKKDFQQLQVIRTMVRDLDVDVKVIACPTVREPYGLAMSSRNSYLSQSGRKQATSLYDSMCLAKQLFEGGETSAQALLAAVEHLISRQPDACIEYARLVDSTSLEEVGKVTVNCTLALAVRIGSTRLIDNMSFGDCL